MNVVYEQSVRVVGRFVNVFILIAIDALDEDIVKYNLTNEHFTNVLFFTIGDLCICSTCTICGFQSLNREATQHYS